MAFIWHAASRGHAACRSDVRNVDCRSHGGHRRIQRNRQVHSHSHRGWTVAHHLSVQHWAPVVFTASLPESLFGAAVPNNYGSNLRTLLAEMYDDKDYKTTQDTLEGLYQQQ
jgi:hypothetical protein